METEDGVPYGCSHHAECAQHQASVSLSAMSAPDFPFHDSDHVTQDTPLTPPQTAESSMDISSGLGFPLGRSMHVECVCQDHQVDEVEADINMMPLSPSPAKDPAWSNHSNQDFLILWFELQPLRDESSPKNNHCSGFRSSVSKFDADNDTALATTDPLSASKLKEDISKLFSTLFEDPLDPANLSIGQSEMSLSNLDLEAELQKILNLPQSDNKDVPRLTDLVPCNASFSTSTPPPLTPPVHPASLSLSRLYRGKALRCCIFIFHHHACPLFLLPLSAPYHTQPLH